MNDMELRKYIQSGINEFLRAKRRSMTEFSKQMIKRYSWGCILWITASYVLAAFDKQVNEGVTIAVVTSLAATLLGYFYKSLKENIKKGEKKKS
jgi:uncharacterized membrane protein